MEVTQHSPHDGISLKLPNATMSRHYMHNDVGETRYWLIIIENWRRLNLKR